MFGLESHEIILIYFMCLTVYRLPELFFVHFLNGILNEDIQDLDFEEGGVKYAVTGVIQYKNNPDHFVCWLREPVGKFSALLKYTNDLVSLMVIISILVK